MIKFKKKKTNDLAKYDIVVVVDKGETGGTHIYKKRTFKTVLKVLEAISNDQVFYLTDDEMRATFFKPSDVSKLQINLRESWEGKYEPKAT